MLKVNKINILIFGVQVGLLVSLSSGETSGGCGGETNDFFLSDADLAQQFPNSPWSIFDATANENPFDPSSQVFGIDDCGGASNNKDTVFILGGQSKFGGFGGKLWLPFECICADDDFSGCNDGCPAEDQIKGVWASDVPSNYVGLIPPFREDHVVVYGEDNGFYIHGGNDQQNDLWLYNATTKNYTRLSDAPGEPRKDMCGAFVDGKLFVFGGIGFDTDKFYNDVLAYDPLDNTWSIVWATDQNATGPAPSEDTSCAGVDQLGLFLFGGVDEDNDLLSDTWLFDTDKNSWMQVRTNDGTSMLPTEDAVGVLVQEEDRIYLFGGLSTPPNAVDSVQVFQINRANINASSWTMVPHASTVPSQSDHCGGALGGVFYGFSGEQNGRKYRTDMIVYDFGSGECPNSCSGRGECDIEFQVCACERGAEGPSCNTRSQIERTIEFLEISNSLKAGFTTAAVIFAVACLGTLVIYARLKKRPAIRASLPNFNIICLFGCALTCCGAIIAAFAFPSSETTFPDGDMTTPNEEVIAQGTTMCYLLSAWYPVCFAIVFSPLFAKVKRVSDVFNNKRLAIVNARVQNRQMLVYVIAIFLIEILLLVAWFLAAPLKFQWIRVASDNEFTESYSSVCYDGSSAETWIVIIGLYNFTLLCFAAYQAYATRHVRFLLDSQSVGFAIYNLGIFSATGMLLHFVLKDDPYAAFAASSIAIFLSVGGILVLLMVPSIRRRNLTAKEVRALITTTGASGRSTAVEGTAALANNNNTAYGDDVDSQSTIAGLRARLRKVEAENADLRFRQGMNALLLTEEVLTNESTTNTEGEEPVSVGDTKQSFIAQA